YDQRAVGGQGPLEAHDLLQRIVPVLWGRLAVARLQNRSAVPRAEERADASTRRPPQPEAPVGRALRLPLRRRRVGLRDEVTSIHPLEQLVEEVAFAGAIDTVDQHQHRQLGVEGLLLSFEQIGPQLRDERLVLLLAEFHSDLCGFEHGASALDYR